AKVNRPECVETTALGAAYLAGLAVGFWVDLEAIKQIRETEQVFEPERSSLDMDRLRESWSKAVERSKAWEEPAG
ncbi:MAG: glycerol kinase, partial [Coraliomargarita sp.]